MYMYKGGECRQLSKAAGVSFCHCLRSRIKIIFPSNPPNLLIRQHWARPFGSAEMDLRRRL